MFKFLLRHQSCFHMQAFILNCLSCLECSFPISLYGWLLLNLQIYRNPDYPIKQNTQQSALSQDFMSFNALSTFLNHVIYSFGHLLFICPSNQNSELTAGTSSVIFTSTWIPRSNAWKISCTWSITLNVFLDELRQLMDKVSMILTIALFGKH